MKKIIVCLFLIAYCFLLIVPVHAGYVLPYPSYMPGNKLYPIARIIDKINNYWYFGIIAQSKYHLGLSDKYLVESKVLFEYKQYLLAVDALRRSDEQVEEIPLYLQSAADQKKDVKILRETIADAMLVHVSIIEAMRLLLPEEFIWRPEKASETTLPISPMLQHALVVRRSVYDALNPPR